MMLLIIKRHPLSLSFLLRFLSSTPSSPQPQEASTSSASDSVRHFLKHNAGLTDTFITSIISLEPRILRADIPNVMEPNLKALRKTTSWSSSQLQQAITANPYILTNPRAVSRLEFWKNLLDNDMQKLLKFSKNNACIFRHDVSTGIAAKISLLNRHGFTRADIKYVVTNGPRFLTRGMASMKMLLEKVEEMGVARGSRKFLQCLLPLSAVGLDKFRAKMEEYGRIYGWSEEEFLVAFSKAPTFVHLCEDTVRRKMEFLVKECGCDGSYIASHPVLLNVSLEKRLRPRFMVLKLLESEGLLGTRMSLFSVMMMSEGQFVKKFIRRNEEKVPELKSMYDAARAGHVDTCR